MGLKVFLTGVSGYLGTVLAAHLADRPEIDCITGVYNATIPTAPCCSKLNLIRMDIRSPDVVRAMADHDIVIHSAFVVMWSARMATQVRDDINFNGTRNVADAAVKNRVRRFVHASSIAAYDPALVQNKDSVDEDVPTGTGVSSFYYSKSKVLAEHMLAEILGSSGTTLTLFGQLISLAHAIAERSKVSARMRCLLRVVTPVCNSFRKMTWRRHSSKLYSPICRGLITWFRTIQSG